MRLAVQGSRLEDKLLLIYAFSLVLPPQRTSEVFVAEGADELPLPGLARLPL